MEHRIVKHARLALAVTPLLLAGCRAFPVGLYVKSDVLDILERSEYEEDLPRAEIAREMSALLDYEGGPAEIESRSFHRVDLEEAVGPFQAAALEHCDHPALAGLLPGDLVLAKNKKPQSLASTLTIEAFCLYDHAGVLAFEHGRPFVYECWPRLTFFPPARDFASHFRGGVRRTPLGTFLGRYETVEFFRLPDAEKNERVVRGARESLDEHIAYDPRHDPDDPALSCSEYILYLLVDKAGYAVDLTPYRVTDNASMRAAMTSLGFRTDAYLMPDSFARLPGATSVGMLSRHDSLSKVVATRCAYEALHHHFATHTELGSYLTVDRWHLVRYRKNVEDFLAWTLGYFEENPTADRERIHADLDTMLPIFFRREGMAVASSGVAP